jgi:PST family polysaccharide transporter
MTRREPSVSANARWLGAGQAVKMLVQLVGIGMLSRLLGPEDFGMMALATVVTSLAGLLRDMGTGPAIIRARALDLAMVDAIFWLNLTVATVVALIVVATAVPLAGAFGAAPLAHLLYGLAITFPIMSFGAAHQALLERESHFRITARADVISYTSGMIAAVVGAHAGLGALSLVLQAIVQACLSSLQLFLASPWRPSLRCDAEHLRRIFAFSSNLTLSNLVMYLQRNADSVIVGRTLGAASLGPYSLAFRIMLYPLQNVSLVASRSLYPVLAMQQAEPQRLSATWLSSTSFVALLTATLMGGLMALREPFVAVALGPRWGEVAHLLLWLAPVGFMQSVLSTAPAAFMVKGRTGTLLWINAGNTVVHIACWIVGAHWGLRGIAAGYLIATLTTAPFYLACIARLLSLKRMALLRAVGAPILLGAGVFAVAFGVGSVLERTELPPLAHLLIAGAAGALYGLWHLGHFHPSQRGALLRTLRVRVPRSEPTL